MNIKGLRFKCSKCGGPKFAGEEYWFAGEYYIDITCAICADTRDVKLSFLKDFVSKMNSGYKRQK